MPLPYFYVRSDYVDKKKLDVPLNSTERYLYGINVRLEILIDMFSSFLNSYANQNNIATTNNVVVEDIEETIDENVKEINIHEYGKLTKKEIIEILEAKGVEYKSTMLKAELIELLKE